MSDKNKGLYQKFRVTRTDGSSEMGHKHAGCKYFVLDLTHDAHAPAAIRAYADSCRDEYPALAADLDAMFPNNNNAWHAKNGDATARDVEQFAARYKRSDGATAWCVVVTEGLGWIEARHVRDVMAMTRADGALVVWVSDGMFAQVVWRKPDAPIAPTLDDDDDLALVRVRSVSRGQYMRGRVTDDVGTLCNGSPTRVELAWVRDKDDASWLTRATARKVSAAYIALADDPDVEIEPITEATS